MPDKYQPPSATVTPIKRASRHQEERNVSEVEIDGRFEKYDTHFNGRDIELHYDEDTGDVIIDGKLYQTESKEHDGYFVVNVSDNHTYKIEMSEGDIFLEGRLIDFTFGPAVPKLERKQAAREGETIVEAPLPGNIVEIAVKIGDEVNAGDKVLTLEAMKMQNDILSDSTGVIEEIYVKEGDNVTNNQKLLLISSNGD